MIYILLEIVSLLLGYVNSQPRVEYGEELYKPEDKQFYTVLGKRFVKIAQGVNLHYPCYLGNGSQWYFMESPQPNIKSHAFIKGGSVFSVLEIDNAQKNNSGLYKCRLKINHFLTVRPRSLPLLNEETTVEGLNPDAGGAVNLDDVVITKLKMVSVGDTLRFTCYGNVYWSYNGEELPTRVHKHEVTVNGLLHSYVYMSSIQQEDAGNYACLGEEEITVVVLDHKAQKPIRRRAYVVYDQEDGMVSPKRQISIVGDRVEFKCLFTEIAMWVFTGNTLLTNVAMDTYQNTDEESSSQNVYNYLILKIFNVQPINAGEYICHFTKIFNVEVRDDINTIDVLNKEVMEDAALIVTSLRTFVGNTLTLLCDAYTKTMWKYNHNHTLPSNAVAHSRLLHRILHSNRLTLMGVEYQNAGTYSCEGSERAQLVVEATRDPLY